MQKTMTAEDAGARAAWDAEMRLEIATAAANIGIWDWDLLSGEMLYSPRAKAICGFPLDREVTFEQVRDNVHPDDYPFTSAQAARALDPAIRDRNPYEYRVIRADGEVRWVLAYGEAVFAEVEGQTRAIRYVGTLQDITERRRLQDAEHAAAQRLRLAIEAGRMAVWEVDLLSDTLAASPELNRIFGFPENASITLDQVRERYAPGERERLQEAAKEAIARGDRFLEAEFGYLMPDGGLRWLLLRCEFLLNKEGNAEKAVGVLSDITERKRAEFALAQQATEQAALFEFTDRLYRAQSGADVFDAALDAITRGLQCDRASILLFDAAGVMRFVAWRGLSDGYRKAVDGHSPWTPDSKDPVPIQIDDLETADLPEELRDTIRSERISALAFFPLLAGERVIGKFMAYFREPHAFTQAELDLGVTIARQLGFSLERRQANEQRDLLVAELSHRVKNTLSTVMSIARQTFGNARDMDAARASFESRLAALAQTHTRLAEENWSGVSLETILIDELSPYRREDHSNVRIDGPRVELDAQCAVTLGMVVHELATNAAKYGSLSTKNGAVEVRWDVDRASDGKQQVVISWTERGGPRVEPPTRSGFGRLLLERALPSSLMGDVKLRFQREGWRRP